MNALAAVLAAVAVAAMLAGAVLMAAGDFGLAGASFLSASIVIYLRERWT